MDCEKFDSLIIDELYGELDELTSAAMKRHATGCSECAEKLRGLRSTREQAVLAEPDFPADLEERIFAATNEAQKVVPITAGRSRLSRAVSLAGTWAMRPQTAMAALFLLMIGSSAVLLRSRQPKDSASLTVTQEGAPSPAAFAANDEKSAEFETKSASAAHGAAGAQPVTASPMATTKSPASPLALNDAPPADLGDPSLNGLGRAGPQAQSERKEEGKKGASAGGGGAPGAAMDKPLGGALAAAPTVAPAEIAAPTTPAAAPPPANAKMRAASESRDDVVTDPFQAGMAAYQGRRFAEATPKLDQAAAQGNASASLWAARSVREGSGCSAAIGRFNAVAAKGGPIGADATFDAARCYESMGDQNAARARYTALLGVPAYAARARAALDSSSEMASRKPEQQQQRPAAGPQATGNGNGNGNGHAGGIRAAPAREAAPKSPAPAPPQTANSL